MPPTTGRGLREAWLGVGAAREDHEHTLHAASPAPSSPGPLGKLGHVMTMPIQAKTFPDLSVFPPPPPPAQRGWKQQIKAGESSEKQKASKRH